MKFSTTFVALAFVLSKTAFAIPVESDSFNLVDRSIYNTSDSAISERTYTDQLEGRGNGTPKPGKTPLKPASPAGSSKPTPDTSSIDSNDSIRSQITHQCKIFSSSQKSSNPSKKPTRSFVSRTTTGETITVKNVQYTLDEEMSGQGGDVTFLVTGGKFYAKRPSETLGTSLTFRQQSFMKEIEHTIKASEALKSNLYAADGEFEKYHWLITKTMEGLPLHLRWKKDPTKFATKAECMKDMDAARVFVKKQQEILAKGAGFVHRDSHPGNWLVTEAGTITKALPIDFGAVGPANTDLDVLLTSQFKYDSDTWTAIQTGCEVCHDEAPPSQPSQANKA